MVCRIMTLLKKYGISYLIVWLGWLLISDRFIVEPVAITRDQAGEAVDCAALIENVKTGHTRPFSVSFPSLFALDERYETVSMFERANGYRFQQCRSEIDLQTLTFCEGLYQTFLEGGRVFDYDHYGLETEESERRGQLCRKHWAQQDFAPLMDDPFELLQGDQDTLIKWNDAWISIRNVEIKDLTTATLLDSKAFPYACVQYHGELDCRVMPTKAVASHELERLIDAMVYGQGPSTLRSNRNSLESAKQ